MQWFQDIKNFVTDHKKGFGIAGVVLGGLASFANFYRVGYENGYEKGAKDFFNKTVNDISDLNKPYIIACDSVEVKWSD